MIIYAYLILTLIAVQSLFHAAVSRSRRGDEEVTVNAVGVLEYPTFIAVEDKNAEGSAKWTGFYPDLIKAISKIVKFKYNIYSSKTYGHLEQGLWHGVVKEIVDKRANVSAIGLSTTPDRVKALDFLQPTEPTGYTFLIKKTPKNIKLKTVAQMANVPDMHYGMRKGGYLEKYFMAAKADTAVARIWRVLQTRGGNNVKSIDEGVQKVRDSDGKYAFAMSTGTATTAVGRPPCELMMAGQLSDKDNALVLRKGDPFKEQLDNAITKLKKNGVFQNITKKWFEGPCHRETPKIVTTPTTSGAGPAAAGLFDGIVLAFLLSAFY